MNQSLALPVPFVRARLMRAAAATAALLLAVLLTAVMLPGAAQAHAGLVSSDPGEGATLTTAPARVTLEFSEPVETPAYVVVTGPDSATHQLDDPNVDGAVVTQALDLATLADARTEGAWTIAYRVVSTDGHAVQGHVRFRVSSAATAAADPGEPASTAMPSDPSDAPSAIPTPSSMADETPTDADTEETEESRGSGVYVVVGATALLAVAVAAAQVRRRTRHDEP